MKIKSIFLTKNIAEISAFQSFCSNNELNLSAQSFITFESVASVFRLPAQVYFFSSKNGVDFFLQQHIIEPNKKIACIGRATKNKLEEIYDSYVFTSPSNVEAFLKYNTLQKNSFVIAWGKTTENALINQPIHVNLVLKSATFEELQNFLKEFNVKK